MLIQFLFFMQVIIYDSSGGANPILHQKVSVVPNTWYEVTIEVLVTDFDASSEYLDVSINDGKFERCTPIVPNSDKCTFHNCNDDNSRANSRSIGSQIVISSKSTININATMTGVDDPNVKCTYQNVETFGVLRITLNALGKMVH